MFFRNFSILAFLSLALSRAQSNNRDSAMAYHNRVDTFLLTDLDNEEEAGQGHLRRKLQTEVCRATNPWQGNAGQALSWGPPPPGGNGGPPPPGGNNQANTNTNSCSGTYACSCGQCPYCPPVATGSGTLCQLSGTSSTFSVPGNSGNMATCTCKVYTDGNVVQNCNPLTPSTSSQQGYSGSAPIPAPTHAPISPTPAPVRPPTPAPVSSPTRAPVRPPTRAPARPPTPAPVSSPTPATSDRAGGTKSSQIVPTESSSSKGCISKFNYNPVVCMGDPEYCTPKWINCNAMLGQYSCSCSGASDQTMCNYCQVQTPHEIMCQVTGSSIRVTGFSGTEQTCSCEDAGNGNVISKCY